ncbi:MAG: hypothetical protein IKK36_00170 [Bacteroidales bacterium]|nr:hypothetical protein [Bacteroidales bacterium]
MKPINAEGIQTAKPFKRRRHKNGFSHSNSEARTAKPSTKLNGVSHRTAKSSTKLNQETPKAQNGEALNEVKRRQPLNGEALNEVKLINPETLKPILCFFTKILFTLIHYFLHLPIENNLKTKYHV